MKEFRYEGLKSGRRVRGTLLAEDRKSAVKKLLAQGVKPINLEEVRKLSLTPFRRRVPEEEIAFSLIQLSVLLSSGIPLTRALDLVSRQVESRPLAEAYAAIKDRLEKGASLSEAFRESGVFPEFLSEMLTAVQRGENLEYIFQITGEYLRKVSEFRSKVLSSVTYPLVIILFSFLSLFVAVEVVVPRIAQVLTDFGKELPLITRLVLLFSDLMGLFLLLLFLALPLFLLRRRLFSREFLDGLFLRIPVLGTISFYFNLARFARVLSMLLQASVPINLSLNLAVKSLSNFYLRRRIEEVIPQVEKGKRLTDVLKKTGLFPELFLNLVETGESSGELERMLELASDLYEKYAERSINFWLRMVEPLSILVIGLIVGIIVLSVLLPLMEITTGLGR
ncbi:MAG: type II secretion system F family protein [Aquificae bacterium]|nr:type II secretion system F family protein [Aquificota bacterium]